MTTTLITKTGLTHSAATCFGMSAVLLSGSGLVDRSGVVGFGGSDLPIAGLKRPMSASVAAEAAANRGHVYAAGAGNHRAGAEQAVAEQAEQQHPMWAFRGPGPWKERT
ncbi:hypothetical protein GXW83_05120 [Streptacidiphilus sp. PB12-B1b]|uniref:hypothetical protein n=1 Tax=Streptacidiphilus sp. PB12-B1b TaxID=2705012 RepID=UPI0015FAAF14|nr:hypothetical protein [Streptacidiphilus sp. PB12-B1b]QMU75232.1 hypothetical protein GXW83_05120 [Streptacidiphilus sp. PB12-B1b]